MALRLTRGALKASGGSGVYRGVNGRFNAAGVPASFRAAGVPAGFRASGVPYGMSGGLLGEKRAGAAVLRAAAEGDAEALAAVTDKYNPCIESVLDPRKQNAWSGNFETYTNNVVLPGYAELQIGTSLGNGSMIVMLPARTASPTILLLHAGIGGGVYAAFVAPLSTGGTLSSARDLYTAYTKGRTVSMHIKLTSASQSTTGAKTPGYMHAFATQSLRNLSGVNTANVSQLMIQTVTPKDRSIANDTFGGVVGILAPDGVNPNLQVFHTDQVEPNATTWTLTNLQTGTVNVPTAETDYQLWFSPASEYVFDDKPITVVTKLQINNGATAGALLSYIRLEWATTTPNGLTALTYEDFDNNNPTMAANAVIMDEHVCRAAVSANITKRLQRVLYRVVSSVAGATMTWRQSQLTFEGYLDDGAFSSPTIFTVTAFPNASTVTVQWEASVQVVPNQIVQPDIHTTPTAAVAMTRRDIEEASALFSLDGPLKRVMSLAEYEKLMEVAPGLTFNRANIRPNYTYRMAGAGNAARSAVMHAAGPFDWLGNLAGGIFHALPIVGNIAEAVAPLLAAGPQRKPTAFASGPGQQMPGLQQGKGTSGIPYRRKARQPTPYNVQGSEAAKSTAALHELARSIAQPIGPLVPTPATNQPGPSTAPGAAATGQVTPVTVTTPAGPVTINFPSGQSNIIGTPEQQAALEEEGADFADAIEQMAEPDEDFENIEKNISYSGKVISFLMGSTEFTPENQIPADQALEITSKQRSSKHVLRALRAKGTKPKLASNPVIVITEAAGHTVTAAVTLYVGTVPVANNGGGQTTYLPCKIVSDGDAAGATDVYLSTDFMAAEDDPPEVAAQYAEAQAQLLRAAVFSGRDGLYFSVVGDHRVAGPSCGAIACLTAAGACLNNLAISAGVDFGMDSQGRTTMRTVLTEVAHVDDKLEFCRSQRYRLLLAWTDELQEDYSEQEQSKNARYLVSSLDLLSLNVPELFTGVLVQTLEECIGAVLQLSGATLGVVETEKAKARAQLREKYADATAETIVKVNVGDNVYDAQPFNAAWWEQPVIIAALLKLQSTMKNTPEGFTLFGLVNKRLKSGNKAGLIGLAKSAISVAYALPKKKVNQSQPLQAPIGRKRKAPGGGGGGLSLNDLI